MYGITLTSHHGVQGIQRFFAIEFIASCADYACARGLFDARKWLQTCTRLAASRNSLAMAQASCRRRSSQGVRSAATSMSGRSR
ncbi:hypothetical protein POHY109586_10500 [Polaromonas hydrogenivorans]